MGINGFGNLVALVLLFAEGSVISWLRSKKRNRDVGGLDNSLHLVGLAVDVVFDDEKQRRAGMQMAERLGLFAIDEGDHVHIQVRDGNVTDDS